MTNNELLDDLIWRGLVHQCTDLDGLAQRLNAGPLSLYCGFDPTAESLHVGSLIPLITLVRFQRAGHRPLALVGGATGLIGDPSGKSAERVLQSAETVATLTAAIVKQLASIVDVTDPAKGAVVNNLEWTQAVTLLDFLRDTGKHFSVNAMVQRDSVRSRLEREGDGISFTEFTYMLLQAFDFLKLAELHDCALQVGGSDQWGNMCSGTDLIRRKLGKEAFALTVPLLTTSDGQKFGKTVKGAVWLDAAKTSPWEFYQFWLNTADADVVRFLCMFTFLSKERILEASEQSKMNPAGRVAQRMLAEAVTALVHGEGVAFQMTSAANVLFGKTGDVDALSLDTFLALTQSMPVLKLQRDDPKKLNAVLVASGLESSMSKANQVIRQGGAVSVNNVSQTDPSFEPTDEHWLHGRFLLLKKGKKHFALVERID